MPEYQHFIPQFILRKYGDYKEPKREDFAPGFPEKFDKAKSTAKKKAKVNVISLENGFDNMKLEARKTKGVCGLNDMYGPEIEKKFGLLEAGASKIIRGIELDFASGSKTTRLSRPDKDTLRRFLFIMLYRRRNFHDRFEKPTEDYDADDKSALMEYMHERGFATPRDVWLDNFRVFLDVPLGHDTVRWEAELMTRAYPFDAEWFIHHMNNFFLCFCTPEDCRDEFLLTQNAYGVFEGPNSHVAWTDWHNFSPISPKLLIILRNMWIQPLPRYPEFDRIKDQFEQLVEISCSIHPDPASARSRLADMPVDKPRPSYPIVQCVGNARGRAQLEHALFSEKDTFDFKLFTLSSKHVQMINTIFLDNAPNTLAIAFGQRTALRRALESYLELEIPGFKVVHAINKSDFSGHILEYAVPNNYDYKYLLGLEKVVQSLGSEVRAKYTISEPDIVTLVPPLSAKFEERYRKLGWDGLPATWFKDIEQAYRITALHSYTERLIRFRRRKIKDRLRENRRNILDSLHPRRIWLHLRMQGAGRRHMENPNVMKDPLLQGIVGNSYRGPEDTIVDASSIFSFSSLSKLMMTASDMNGYLNVYRTDGQEAPFWCHAGRAYAQIGSILCCGSSLLGDRAAAIYSWIISDPKKQEMISRQSRRLSISRDYMIELMVRIRLDEELGDVLGKALPADVRKNLRPILMDIVYPTRMSTGQLSLERA